MAGKTRRASMVFVSLGIVLILGAAGLLLYMKKASDISVNDVQQILSQAEECIPTATDQAPEERRNNTMSSMEIEGANIVGLIEIPKYDCKLPIHATWNTNIVSSMPCRYTGSIYNRTLIIGAADGEGQIDFANLIDVDDRIYITDMEGGRYTYAVSRIEHSDSAETDKLQSNIYDLTIFVKNSLSMDYIIIRCKTA